MIFGYTEKKFPKIHSRWAVRLEKILKKLSIKNYCLVIRKIDNNDKLSISLVKVQLKLKEMTISEILSI